MSRIPCIRWTGKIALAVALQWTLAVAHAEPAPLGDGGEYEVRVAAVALGKPDLSHVRGSAFLVGPKGLMVTADHVLGELTGDASNEIYVLRPTSPNLTICKASVVKRLKTADSTRDLAFLQMARETDAPDLPFFEIAENPQVGEEVFLLGYPLVFDRVYRWPLFRFGRVSSVKYFLKDSKVLVLDLTSANGFSGAPVVRRSDGKVLAVQKGGATGNKEANFSLGTVITLADLPAGASAGIEGKRK